MREGTRVLTLIDPQYPLRFSTLMERAEVMTSLRSGGHAEFPQSFEDRVPENAKKVCTGGGILVTGGF